MTTPIDQTFLFLEMGTIWWIWMALPPQVKVTNFDSPEAAIALAFFPIPHGLTRQM